MLQVLGSAKIASLAADIRSAGLMTLSDLAKS
jgi:hypothetical protein